MAQVIAVRNLPRVEEAVKLWGKHGLAANSMGLARKDEGACLVAILAIDRGYDWDTYEHGMYEFVAEHYDVPIEDVDDVELGFMGCDRVEANGLAYYEYGKAIAREVL